MNAEILACESFISLCNSLEIGEESPASDECVRLRQQGALYAKQLILKFNTISEKFMAAYEKYSKNHDRESSAKLSTICKIRTRAYKGLQQVTQVAKKLQYTTSVEDCKINIRMLHSIDESFEKDVRELYDDYKAAA